MSLKEHELVSVIIPVHNGAPFLAEALESVLNQTYRPIELIVVDDGSTDGSAQVVQQYSSADYIYQDHQGAAAARNRGVSAVRGEYIAFLDADDVWLKEKLALQIAAFHIDPAPDLVFGHVKEFRDVRESHVLPEVNAVGSAVPGLILTTMVARKEAFQKVGSFTSHWRIADFLDWYVRAQELGLTTKMLPQVVAKRRLHGANLSLSEKEYRSEYVSILKSALDRRRKSGKSGTGVSSNGERTT